MRRYVFLLSALVLLPACRSTTGETQELKSVEVSGATPEGGGAVYFAEGGKVYRFACSAKTLAEIPDGVTLDDPAAVRKYCAERPAKSGAPTLAAFESALSGAYMTLVEDTELNEMEKLVLQNITQALPGGSASKKPLKLERAARPAGDQIAARFAGLFDAAYDGTSAARPLAAPEDTAGGNGLNLAGATNVAVGTLSFKTNFPSNTNFNLAVVGNASAVAVDTLMPTTTLTPSGTCRAQPIGIASVTAMTPSGPASVPVSAHPMKPGAFRINGGAAVRVQSVTVTVRRSGLLGGNQTCSLRLVGEATDTPPPPPPPNDRDGAMKGLMAQRTHRMWHFLWHGIRNAWPSMTTSQKNSIRNTLGAEWGRSNTETQANPAPNKGEEFLHMHRGMLLTLREYLGAAKMYEAWKAVPTPQDTGFPVPGGNTSQSNAEYTQRIVPWQTQAMDAGRLKTMTLSAYGEWIERTLHNTMHMRWADSSKASLEGMQDIFQTPQAAWDDPNADYLGSTYSSHVNPIFYRLHGFVDARIEDWLKANNFTSIADNCAGVAKCYQWKGVWDGPLPPRQTPLPQSAPALGADPETGVMRDIHDHGFDPDAFEKLSRSLRRLIRENSNMFPVLDDAELD